jgi:N-acetylneuraminic acid mutarotase
VNGKIYAIGGWDGVGDPSAVCSIVEEYDPTTDIWTAKANMPTARGALAVSTLNGRIYAIGGVSSDGQAIPTVEEYDPVADTWTKKVDMLTERGYLSASAANGRIYAIGGINTNSEVLSATEEYNPMTDKWTKKDTMTRWKYHPSTSALNGKIYVMGGWLSGGKPALILEEYDPVKGKWTKKSDMIPSLNVRGDVSTVAANGIILVFGGQRAVDVPVFTVEEYRINAAPSAPRYKLEDAIIGKWKMLVTGADVSMEFFMDGTCRLLENEKLSEADYEFIDADRMRLGPGNESQNLKVQILKDKLFLTHPNGNVMEAIRVTENAKPE